MTRQRFELSATDVAVLARALDVDSTTLQDELAGRPWYVYEVLARPEVAETILHGRDDAHLDDVHLMVSPALFFTVAVHRSADELGSSDWVDEWVGPGCRLPVFDVDPLVEFTDAPGRLAFVARLLGAFTAPCDLPVPAGQFDFCELADWLGAVDTRDRPAVLRRLGDLALFQAGVFPDSTGATLMSPAQVERLAKSVELTDDELDQVLDPASPTPGLDTLEAFGAAWYRAAADTARDAAPDTPVLRDVAHRIRAARRFLNYVTDHYVYQLTAGWGFAS